MQIIPFVSPPGKVGTSYEHVVKLSGTGPFSLGEYFVPVGWSANIVGSTLTFGGLATEPESGAAVSFEVFSCCDCEPVTLTSSIVIARACSYSWSMTPSIAPVGTKVKTTFTPPASCPADTVLVLALFEGNGVTPLVIPSVSPYPLEISVNRGSSEYVIQPDDAGRQIVFRPSLEQSACLSTCIPSNTIQRRIVPALAPCTVSWDVQPRAFTAGVATPVTYTASGPPGGRLKLIMYVGNVIAADFLPLYVPFDAPLSFVNTWRVADIGLNYNWRVAPLIQQDTAVQLCTLQPTQVNFTVAASVCVINWRVNPSPVVVGQVSGLQVVSGPPNCAIAFEAYTVPGDTLIAGSRTTILTDATGTGSTSPSACLAPGGSITWKPVTPQPSACAAACTFGALSFLHVCTGAVGTVPGTCGLVLTATCAPLSTTRFDVLAAGLSIGVSYQSEEYNGTVWVGGATFVAAATTRTLGYDRIATSLTHVRLVNAARTCVSNEVAHPCVAPPAAKFYCVSGACAQAATPPSGSSGPYDTLALCQVACGGSGIDCSTNGMIRSVGTFYSGAPCGTTIPFEVVTATPWSTSFSVGAGTTATASNMPAGMVANMVGSELVLTWATTTTGVYAITVTGVKAGCLNCTFPITLTVKSAIAAGAACARLRMEVLKGPSAYTPATGTSFNAADQLLRTTFTGPPGKTFQIREVITAGAVTTVSGVMTFPASGEITTTGAVGQAVLFSTTWSIEPAGADPITVCSGAGSVLITGDTGLRFAIGTTANTYTLYVLAPPGATGVPFTLKFGGPTFQHLSGAVSSALCADNNFGVLVTHLTTNSANGGNQFIYPSAPLPLPYSAAFQLALNPTTSALTHQLVGTVCNQISLA